MALHNTFSIIRLINQTIAMKKKHFLMALIIALCSSPTYAQYVLHIAGNNTSISGGDGEPATTAGFNNTYSICMDAMHNLYVNDNAKVRKIDWVTGIITAIAGGGGAFDTTDNIPATSANLAGAWGLCTNELDGIEYLYIADGRNKIRQVNLTTGIITTVAGSGELGYGGDGGPATAAQLGQPRDVAVDEEGNIYIAEYYNSTVRKVSVATGIITTIAGIATPVSGSYGGDGGPATAALLDRPEGVSLDSSGNIYIADTYNNRIRRIDAVTGNITTVAGRGPTGLGSYGGDGGLATDAAVFAAFQAMATNSRYALLTQIEGALASGDTAGAQTILNNFSVDSMANVQNDTATGVQMADDTTADAIVVNYRQYYQLYINYQEGTLSSSDSTALTALANLCPITGGNVVFKARALYDIVYDTLVIFPDNCPDSVIYDSAAERMSHPTGVKAITDSKGQQYTLYPNPNDGNFILQQVLADDAPVQAEVWDVTGRVLYKDKLQFTDLNAKMRVVNAVPGMYLLQLTDSKGQIFRFKFVVQ